MFYLLTDLLKNWLDQSGLFSVVRVFLQLEFRAFLAVLVGFAAVLAFGKPVIRWLRKQKVGDAPEFYNERLNEMMKGKSGTPTMGGVLIIGSVLLTTDFYHNELVRVAMLVMVWFAGIGGFDDWLKLTAARRGPGTREGLYAWEKLLFQLGMASLACYFLYRHGIQAENPASLALNLPFQRTYVPVPMQAVALQKAALQLNPSVWVLTLVPFMLIGTLAIAGMSNAVNITDGMDGLAAGTMTIASFAMMILCYIASQQSSASFLLVPHVPEAKELMVITGAMAGACLGFLWFNCNPASVFMGDTGSLSLGGLLAFVAVAIRQEFLLLLIGGIFIMEIGSVVIQVSYFKWTKGKRIFRCSPIHHHFHMGGLSELQVVTRFWIVAIIFTMLALVSIKLR
jgi:phospho-N-acetylmuramoyl-pentapeptide-transferase